jgi:hypothetical protein
VQIWKPGTGQDSARYLIPDSQLYFKRPRLISGTREFVWPIGVEGFRRSGSALLAIHRPIGHNTSTIQVINKDESRIELTGTFPGRTAKDNMIALIDVIMATTPEKGKVLVMPGIFPREQYVYVENYDFVHDAEDRTHSIAYTITFIREAVGDKIKNVIGKPPVPNPTAKKKPKGKPARTFTVKDGARTLRAIAQAVYKNPDKWRQIANLNDAYIQKALKPGGVQVNAHQLPTFRWPIGTKFRY